MAVLLYHLYSFIAVFSYGLYFLVSAARAHLKHPHHRDYAARPYHPLPLPPQSRHLLRHLPLYLALLALAIAVAHQLISAAVSDPLLRGRTPVHRLEALQFAAVLLLFLLLALALLLSHSQPHILPLPPDLAFLLAALAFGLLYAAYARSAASYNPPDDLPARCDAVASVIAAASAVLCLALAIFPRLFVAELALAGSVSLLGLWLLQTGLSLYAEDFIPEGCHRLLDVAAGIDGSTRCVLEESRLRAAALLDLALALHATFVAVLSVVVYAAVSMAVGGGAPGGGVRRMGSYEALPTASSAGALSDMDHVQMKAMGKNAMQA
ncbi:hypothetical protein Taro_024157 [Colocasia esculenta]|uniref:Uncharacterized protein n=1 Tax=Colocasia esculenta TaxID=4460 RepID=A0A843VCW8_COLES|nr:hypothetical protein [Colocasia esculenta]